MPSQPMPPPISIPWYMVPVLLVVAAVYLPYDRYRTWRHSRR